MALVICNKTIIFFSDGKCSIRILPTNLELITSCCCLPQRILHREHAVSQLQRTKGDGLKLYVSIHVKCPLFYVHFNQNHQKSLKNHCVAHIEGGT